MQFLRDTFQRDGLLVVCIEITHNGQEAVRAFKWGSRTRLLCVHSGAELFQQIRQARIVGSHLLKAVKTAFSAVLHGRRKKNLVHKSKCGADIEKQRAVGLREVVQPGFELAWFFSLFGELTKKFLSQRPIYQAFTQR